MKSAAALAPPACERMRMRTEMRMIRNSDRIYATSCRALAITVYAFDYDFALTTLIAIVLLVVLLLVVVVVAARGCVYYVYSLRNGHRSSKQGRKHYTHMVIAIGE